MIAAATTATQQTTITTVSKVPAPTAYSVANVASTTPPHDGAEPAGDLPRATGARPDLPGRDRTGDLRGGASLHRLVRRSPRFRFRSGIYARPRELSYPLESR